MEEIRRYNDKGAAVVIYQDRLDDGTLLEWTEREVDGVQTVSKVTRFTNDPETQRVSHETIHMPDDGTHIYLTSETNDAKDGFQATFKVHEDSGAINLFTFIDNFMQEGHPEPAQLVSLEEYKDGVMQSRITLHVGNIRLDIYATGPDKEDRLRVSDTHEYLVHADADTSLVQRQILAGNLEVLHEYEYLRLVRSRRTIPDGTLRITYDHDESIRHLVLETQDTRYDIVPRKDLLHVTQTKTVQGQQARTTHVITSDEDLDTIVSLESFDRLIEEASYIWKIEMTEEIAYGDTADAYSETWEYIQDSEKGAFIRVTERTGSLTDGTIIYREYPLPEDVKLGDRDYLLNPTVLKSETHIDPPYYYRREFSRDGSIFSYVYKQDDKTEGPRLITSRLGDGQIIGFNVGGETIATISLGNDSLLDKPELLFHTNPDTNLDGFSVHIIVGEAGYPTLIRSGTGWYMQGELSSFADTTANPFGTIVTMEQDGEPGTTGTSEGLDPNWSKHLLAAYSQIVSLRFFMLRGEILSEYEPAIDLLEQVIRDKVVELFGENVQYDYDAVPKADEFNLPGPSDN